MTLWESSNCGINCDKQGIRNSLTPCVVCPRPEPQGSRKNSPVQDLPKRSFHLSSHLRFLLLSTDRNLLDFWKFASSCSWCLWEFRWTLKWHLLLSTGYKRPEWYQPSSRCPDACLGSSVEGHGRTSYSFSTVNTGQNDRAGEEMGQEICT